MQDKTRIKTDVPSSLDDKTQIYLDKTSSQESIEKEIIQKGTTQNDATQLHTRQNEFHDDATALASDIPTLKESASHLQQASTHVDVGTIIRERFVLQRLLGEGSMGAVYQAVDLRKQEAGDETPNIALKILSDEFKHHPKAFITLQREAKKTQELAHPNIVTVYDFDRDNDLVYITMEELKGDSLLDVISGLSTKKYNPEERLGLIQQIAEGLSYAHEKGLVHSDLKPGNIFVTNKGVAKILDFGIARAAQEGLYQDSFDVGELGALTLKYASAEMFNNEPPHPSDDIYALGIIISELLGDGHAYDRIEANKALSRGLSPKVPKTKNILFKRLFLQSVALRRKDRIPDAAMFLKRLHGARKLPKQILIASFVILIGLTVNFIFLQNAMVEHIDFKELSQQEQSAFNDYMREARQALTFGDINAAVVYFDKAYQLHPVHDGIEKDIEKIIHMMIKTRDQATTNQAARFADEQLTELKKYPAFSENKIFQKMLEGKNIEAPLAL